MTQLQTLGIDEFLAQAKAVGVGYDPRYPQSQSLIPLPPNGHCRFWTRPSVPVAWPDFVSNLLKAAGANDTVLLFPRSKHWPDSRTAFDTLTRTQAVLTEAQGIPPGWKGAIEFAASERDRLIAVLVAQFLEPFNDMYVLSLHGTALLQFDHHDVIHVRCRTAEAIEAAIAVMKAARYALPEELPDATFKRPGWMQGPSKDAGTVAEATQRLNRAANAPKCHPFWFKEPMSLAFEQVFVSTDEAQALVKKLEAELSGPYSAEQRHGLSLEGLLQPNVQFFLARLHGRAVACGGVAFDDGLAEVKRLYVRPPFRRHGIARELLSHLEAIARARGSAQIVLETGDVLTGAIALYERAGYRRRNAFGVYAQMSPRAIERSVFFEKRIA